MICPYKQHMAYKHEEAVEVILDFLRLLSMQDSGCYQQSEDIVEMQKILET